LTEAIAGKFPDRVSSRAPILLSRRRLLAASGATLAAGAPAALAACGSTDEDEEATPGEEAELLNAVMAQQLAVQDALAPAGGNVPSELEQPVGQLVDLREESTQELARTISELGGEPVDQAADLVGAESPAEGLARQLETSIAASLEAIGELAPERRVPVHQAITEDAAVLATIRSVLGEEIAPDAFVMGAPASTGEAP
jgi:hypothetical protein